jgi:hypothetical protein
MIEAVVPLGDGTPLFDRAGRVEMRQAEVQISPHAAHLTYELG